MRPDRSFFADYTPTVAKRLLGMVLVRQARGSRLSGIVVEAEAYRAEKDPASHAYRGETKRNSVMFGEPGHAYIYFTYGFHWCLNITTEEAGHAGAVLIRALQPLEGIDKMKKNRSKEDLLELTSGPGKLTQALAIDGDLNGEDIVLSKKLFVEDGARDRSKIGRSARIGISAGLEFKWRYFLEGNPSVSRVRPRDKTAENA